MTPVSPPNRPIERMRKPRILFFHPPAHNYQIFAYLCIISKILHMKTVRILAAAAIIMSATAAADTPQQINYSDSATTRSLVFNMGDFGSRFYRIPGLALAKDGAIIAVADRRIETMSDLPGKIDVVARRSTDNGRTWSQYIMVAEHDSTGGYGDPAIVTDRRNGNIIVISTHGNGLWQQTPGHISISRSVDNGLTWLPPVDINPQILTTDSLGKQPIKCCSAFASSGRALQLKNGRIIFALVTRQPGVEGFPVYAVYSDDSGHTWHVSKNPATLDGDESKIVELPDGTLLMSIRNRWGEGRYDGKRIFSRSTNHGRTWSAPQPGTLHASACNGSIIRYRHDGNDVLLHSVPAPGAYRENVTIYMSSDNGINWVPTHRVVRAPSAYSEMLQLSDGSLGIITEEGIDATGPRQGGGYRIWYTRLSPDRFLSPDK